MVKVRRVIKRDKIRAKIRSKVKGTSIRPRLSVFRSNKHIYAQLIDDERSVSLGFVNDNQYEKIKKMEKAQKVGEKIGKVANKKNITKVVFDRSGYKYQGRVKALAEGARSKGLKF